MSNRSVPPSLVAVPVLGHSYCQSCFAMNELPDLKCAFQSPFTSSSIIIIIIVIAVVAAAVVVSMLMLSLLLS